jgi:hypothetical protein
MEFTKRGIRQIALGGLAGFVSYFILLLSHSPWEEAIAAVLIGSAAGHAFYDSHRMFLGGLICVTGWLVGAMLFGVVSDLGIGAWIPAGAALGAGAGVVARSLSRVILGLSLGLAAGVLAELTRFATVMFSSLRGVDMQLLLLLSAGCLLPLISFLTVWRKR